MLKPAIILAALNMMAACHSTNRSTIKKQEKMFTVAQIQTAHSKVKSGADFPAYIRNLKTLGVLYYETFVADGHTNYYGANDYETASPAKYDSLKIAETPDIAQFKSDLLVHQQGQTNYQAFCNDAAKSGIEKWVVCITEMTCTYYDKGGNRILVEEIPR